MTPRQDGEVTSPATERAEQILQRAGARLGVLAGRTRLRLQQAAQSLREQADHMDTPHSAARNGSAQAPGTPNAQANAPVKERAEEMVDQLGQRVNHWTAISSLQVRKTLARLREDGEDMWVEAHHTRRKWQSKREQP